MEEPIAIVGADIRIRDCPFSIRRYFEEKLTFSNPDFYKKQAMGRWTGNTPEQIVLYERNGRDLILPFGMLPEVFRMRNKFSQIESEIGERQRVEYHSKINLYDYQETALKSAIRKRQGVVVAPCGAGKTMLGLQLAATIGLKTLWLTHTQDLLNQSMNKAIEVYGLSEGDIGTITGGKIDIGNVITFATVQTACKIDLKKYRDAWGCVIVDECHRVSGTPTRVTMFSRVLSEVSARYKFGLTATPKRSDGLTLCMFALLGEKVAEIQKTEVSTTCPVEVRFVETNYQPDYTEILNTDGTINYAAYINDVSTDKERNRQIAEEISKLDGTVLVLTDRVKHEALIARELRDFSIDARKLSYEKKDGRQKMLNDLRDKRYKVLIATYALAKEGLDIPTLDNLVLATPQKSEGTVVQSVGRVARKADGKEFGVVLDVVDDCVMFDRMARSRKRIYKKNGWI